MLFKRIRFNYKGFVKAGISDKEDAGLVCLKCFKYAEDNFKIYFERKLIIRFCEECAKPHFGQYDKV